VRYFQERPEGRRALAPLAATQGVFQGPSHHLDVYDHTLLALAYLEAILDDPAAALCTEAAGIAALDRLVASRLREQGIALLPLNQPVGTARDDAAEDAGVAECESALWDWLHEQLTEETRTLLKWVMLFHDVGKPATRQVSVDAAHGRRDVQFIGHEVYGAGLVTEQLEHLYGGDGGDGEGRGSDALRQRARHLILRHHAHHNLINRYSDPGRLAALRHAVDTWQLADDEWQYLSAHCDPQENAEAACFPLLILHGYADTLACRGVKMHHALTRVAEIDRLLLHLHWRWPELARCRAMRHECRRLMKGLNTVLNLEGPLLGQVMRRVEEWFLARTCQSQDGSEAAGIPTMAEVQEQAAELLETLRDKQE
jgi:hypothetical protein